VLSKVVAGELVRDFCSLPRTVSPILNFRSVCQTSKQTDWWRIFARTAAPRRNEKSRIAVRRCAAAPLREQKFFNL